MRSDRSVPALFLRRLERKLAGLPGSDRARIVAEVRGHLEEQRARFGDDGSEAVAALGPPDLIGRALARARRPRLARRLAALALAQASRAGAGALVLLAGLFYAAALVLTATAAMKLLLPEHVGLWTAPHQFTFGVVSAPAGASSERLGFWLVPWAGLLAGVCAAAGAAAAKGLRGMRSRSPGFSPA